MEEVLGKLVAEHGLPVVLHVLASIAEDPIRMTLASVATLVDEYQRQERALVDSVAGKFDMFAVET